MSVIMYVVGGASIATGSLTAGGYLLSLTSGTTWHTRLRRWTRIRPATKPRARRRAWNDFSMCLGCIVTGALLVLSVGDPALSWLTMSALIALLIWRLVSGLTRHVQRRSVS